MNSPKAAKISEPTSTVAAVAAHTQPAWSRR